MVAFACLRSILRPRMWCRGPSVTYWQCRPPSHRYKGSKIPGPYRRTDQTPVPDKIQTEVSFQEKNKKQNEIQSVTFSRCIRFRLKAYPDFVSIIPRIGETVPFFQLCTQISNFLGILYASLINEFFLRKLKHQTFTKKRHTMCKILKQTASQFPCENCMFFFYIVFVLLK